jgi:hypothetical protein
MRLVILFGRLEASPRVSDIQDGGHKAHSGKVKAHLDVFSKAHTAALKNLPGRTVEAP